MKTTLSLATLALLCGAVQAAVTNIAQLPLLNITGTGTVKPNLMLLYDNSGSMAWNYEPDYVADATTCRSRLLMSGGTTACVAGHPPFNSPDFNKLYYNPKIYYLPPVNSDGSSFSMAGIGNASPWSAVSTDVYGKNNVNLSGVAASSTNLASGFPDLKWCNGGSCVFNSATYTYPDNTYTTATAFNTNPYYYTINVAEYCTDATLTTCQTTAVGAAAPTGYPVAAKVRWCNSTALTSCQAKYLGAYKYPRFSSPNSGLLASYGTITINASASSGALSISSVVVADPAGVSTISNGAVVAASGTNSTTKQATLATSLALSIINKTGLSNQYTACVRTPTGTDAGSVAACTAFGITLATDNMVAVIPIDCSSAAVSKAIGQCSVLPDSTRSGWAITVTSPVTTITPAVPPTAVITVSGTTSTANAPVLAGVSLGGTALFSSSLTLAKSAAAATVAGAIKSKIGTVGTITAYTGGNSITPTCQGKTSSSICLVNSAGAANGSVVTLGSISNNSGAAGTAASGTTVFTPSAGAGYAAAVTDTIPASSTPLSAGNAVFVRIDIVPARTSYPKDASRGDCSSTAGICTYAEEMSNFANWYAYYKTRNQMMKTAVGQAFAPINSNYRVGLVTLSVAGIGGAISNVPKEFSGADRDNWYTSLYAISVSGSTPLRAAMHNVGKMFSNLSPYVATSGSEVVQYPCQQNFIIMTTDGYWNGTAASDVVNNDNAESAARFCTRARGCVDPASQTTNSLADVALYWYNGGSNTGTVSLRPVLEDMSRPGSVPAAAGENTHLHINTYTLGLGVDGVMTYEAAYDTAPLVGGDFYKLITGVSSACPWNASGAYVWPDPVTSDASGSASYQSRVDDLWHTAINGHGKYFSASAPQEVVNGLSAALNNMQVRVGAAAAAATSTPNISQQDDDIFTDTFTTVKWYGELSDKKIDITTGIVGSAVTWSSSDRVGLKVAASTDTRRIYMLDTAGGAALKSFTYGALSATEQGWFDGKCVALAQCTSLSVPNKAIVNNGNNLVNWLRGQQQYANDSIFRAYALTSATPSVPIVLGDIASSKPAFLREPRKAYTMSGYADFKSANANRAATVFTAANDGMLHAFNVATGDESWAYAPRITMKKLYAQAGTTYATNHQFSTDGSPELGDVQIGSTWKTVLVAGLNGGGRGYYALDVTDPANPVALWELCADTTLCSGHDAATVSSVANLGLSFGNPQFGYWNGKWVVYLTSGYNNVPSTDGVASGDGVGYLFIVDVANGNILKTVSTGSGSSATPSGLAKITAISLNPFSDPNTTYVYGGDNQGQMWRFDLTGAPAVLVNRMGNAGVLQPITTRPDVTTCAVTTTAADGSVSTAAKLMVLFGTGRLLDVPDTSNTDQQSLYLLRDSASEVTPWRAVSTMVERTLSLQGSASNINTYTVSVLPLVDLSTRSGWFLDWDQNPGERMNLDPKIVDGGANVVTNIPSSSSACSVGGTSNVYQLNVCTGSYISADTIAGSTLSNTSAAVGFIIIRLPSGALKMITTTAAGNTITSGVTPANSTGARKVGWRRVRN